MNIAITNKVTFDIFTTIFITYCNFYRNASSQTKYLNLKLKLVKNLTNCNR